MDFEQIYKEKSGFDVGKIHEIGTTYYSDDYVKWLEEKLLIQRVMQRFKGFIDEYERNIVQEESLLKTLDPIETCDDVLYELKIRRDALVKCYERVFNGA